MILKMKPINFRLIFLFVSLFVIFITFLSYRTSVAQLLINNDRSNDPRLLSFSEVDDMLNGYPNISASALPIDIWRVQYSLWGGNINKAKEFVNTAANANP